MADIYNLSWWGVDASLFLKEWALASNNNITCDARLKWKDLSKDFPGKVSISVIPTTY
jgi:hypothetical protein